MMEMMMMILMMMILMMLMIEMMMIEMMMIEMMIIIMMMIEVMIEIHRKGMQELKKTRSIVTHDLPIKFLAINYTVVSFSQHCLSRRWQTHLSG